MEKVQRKEPAKSDVKTTFNNRALGHRAKHEKDGTYQNGKKQSQAP